MDFVDLAKQCAPYVDVQTISAIVKTESGFNPFAIGVNYGGGKVKQPTTLEDAIQKAEQLIAQGKNIDMGLGQINSANLPRLKLSVRQVFDPCTNLKAAAAILKEGYLRANPEAVGEHQAVMVALSTYNTGSTTKGFKNGYVDKVVNNADVKVPAIKELSDAEVDAVLEPSSIKPKPKQSDKVLTPSNKVLGGKN